MKTKTFLAFVSATVMAVATSSAAITVTNTSANILEDTSNSGLYTNTITNWSLSGGNTVVVYFSGENTTGMTAKYGTQDMTVVQGQGGGNDWISAIAYIVNPTVSLADLAVSWTAGGNSENMITALSLSGVGSVAGSSSINAGNLSFSYTTTLAGGFVVGNATNNSFDFLSPPTVSSSNLDTNVFYSNISGNSSSLQTYGVIDTAGTYTDTYSNSLVGAGVAFNPIPEPSAALLGALGFLALLRRRR